MTFDDDSKYSENKRHYRSIINGKENKNESLKKSPHI